MLAVAYVIMPVARSHFAPVEVAEESTWRGEVCVQSHASTCAPAAAASLLRLAGIKTNEQEMTRACLTSRHGTEPLGLFRGLVTAVKHSDRYPIVASTNPDDWTGRSQLPNIALVKFADAHSNRSRRLLGPWGEGHAVLVLGRTSTGWIIGDPAFGKTVWTDQDFRGRFTGEAIYMSPRR